MSLAQAEASPAAAEPWRVALYWAPAESDPLHTAASQWLGRDAVSGVPLTQPALPEMAAITADARGYGLHATLKPPFRLAQPLAEVEAAAAALARRLKPFSLPPLEVSDLSGFLALRESTPCPPLHALADACVEALDPCRAPPTQDELARRRKRPLSEQEEAMLSRWGYPHVFALWRFHLTLTRRLTAAEKAIYLPAAQNALAAVAGVPRAVDTLTLFAQAAPGAPFHILKRLPFGAA